MKEPVPTPLVIVIVAILLLLGSMIGHVIKSEDNIILQKERRVK